MRREKKVVRSLARCVTYEDCASVLMFGRAGVEGTAKIASNAGQLRDWICAENTAPKNHASRHAEV